MRQGLHPSRERVARAVVASLRENPSGGAYLVTGPQRSGRTAVLAEIERRLSSDYACLRLTMRGGPAALFEPRPVDEWLPRADRAGKYIALSSKAVRFLSPEAAAAARGVGTGLRFAAGVGRRWRARSELTTWLPQDLLQAVRAAPIPSIVLVDDFDESDLPAWWWSQFFIPLLGDVAGGAGLGVVLTSRAAPVSDSSFTRAFRAGLQHLELGLVTAEDVLSDAAPESVDAIDLVVDLAGSEPALIAKAREELLRLGRRADAEGKTDILRLRRSTFQRKVTRTDPQWDPVTVERLLHAASLQRNFFTAETTARTLGLDPDEAIDLLDDIEDKTGPDSWVNELDHVALTNGRTLWRYTLSPSLCDELFALRSDNSLDATEVELADALLEDYDVDAWICASQAVSIYLAHGLTQRADGARLLCNEAEASLLKLQLDVLVAPAPVERSPMTAEQDADLAMRLLDRFQSSLPAEGLIAYATAIRDLARPAGEASETYLLATARLATALAVTGGRDAEAVDLAADVLTKTSDDEAALAALWSMLMMQRRGDWQVAVTIARDVESLAERLGNEDTAMQALALRADLQYAHGISFEDVAPDLRRFARIASPMNPMWATCHRIVMHDAYRRGDLATLRSEYEAAERHELAGWNYDGAARLTLYLLQAENELHKSGSDVTGDRLRFLVSRASAHAARSGEAEIAAVVRAMADRIGL